MVSIHLHTEIPPNRALFTGLQQFYSKHFVKKTPANLLFEGWTLLFVTESDQLDVPENHLAWWPLWWGSQQYFWQGRSTIRAQWCDGPVLWLQGEGIELDCGHPVSKQCGGWVSFWSVGGSRRAWAWKTSLASGSPPPGPTTVPRFLPWCTQPSFGRVWVRFFVFFIYL